MKLQDLKIHVYECWKCLSEFKGAIVQPENFKDEVRRFGDLRFKETWKKAYCQFWAKNLDDCGVPNSEFITIFFNFQSDQWDYELRYEIFDAFLQMPTGLERLRNGLEQLFGSSTQEENIDGFLELVQGATGGEHGRIPIGFIRRIAASQNAS